MDGFNFEREGLRMARIEPMHRVGVADESAEALLPLLASGNALSVDAGAKACEPQSRIYVARLMERHGDAKLTDLLQTASAIFGNLSVKFVPWRLQRVTRPPSPCG